MVVGGVGGAGVVVGVGGAGEEGGEVDGAWPPTPATTMHIKPTNKGKRVPLIIIDRLLPTEREREREREREVLVKTLSY